MRNNELVNEKRISLNETPLTFGARFNKSRATISRWETGITPVPDYVMNFVLHNKLPGENQEIISTDNKTINELVKEKRKLLRESMRIFGNRFNRSSGLVFLWEQKGYKVPSYVMNFVLHNKLPENKPLTYRFKNTLHKQFNWKKHFLNFTLYKKRNLKIGYAGNEWKITPKTREPIKPSIVMEFIESILRIEDEDLIKILQENRNFITEKHIVDKIILSIQQHMPIKENATPTSGVNIQLLKGNENEA
ncbi:MAG: hypothetical protein PHE73_08650 [Sulfurovaceae bacterium]|nr:hypothetical protein [Sulfurovaceae bacterium]